VEYNKKKEKTKGARGFNPARLRNGESLRSGLSGLLFEILSLARINFPEVGVEIEDGEKG